MLPRRPDAEPGPVYARAVSETAVRRRRPWEGLSHNVHVLSGVSFFQDAASEMLYPVLPLFITGVLGAPPAVVGLIEGLAEGTASILKVASGWLADRMRRKPLIAVGYSLSSISKLVIGLAYTWPLVLVARVADRTGKGIRGAPRDALIADDTPQADRGRAFGFHRAADTFGAVVGPLIGLALYFALGQRMRPLFFIAFIPAAISVGLIVFVRERPRTHQERATAIAARDGPLPRPYRRVVAFLTIFGLVNFTDALLLLRAKELGFGFAGVVLVYTLYNLTYSLLSYPAGTWSGSDPPPEDLRGRDRRVRGLVLRPGRDHVGGVGVGAAARVRSIHGAHRRGEPGVGGRPRARRARDGPRDLRGAGAGRRRSSPACGRGWHGAAPAGSRC